MKSSICICIMCTNEENVIEKTLTQLLPYATDYIICDNESTDNTIHVCQNFFNHHHIQGQIFNYKWVNKGHNYTYLYELAYKYTQSDYFWVFDAEDEIVGDLQINQLEADCYQLNMGNENLKYKRPQIFKNKLPLQSEQASNCKNTLPLQSEQTSDCKKILWKYYLPVHGYTLTYPKRLCTKDAINGDYYIKAIRNGIIHQINNKEKYLNYAKLLEDELQKNDLDSEDITRCHFYIAQCYKCSDEYKKSIHFYKKRIKLAGPFQEEIFLSHVYIGQCYQELFKNVDDKHFIKAILWYINSWKYRQTRSEGLYYATKLLRENHIDEQAYRYAIIGKYIPLPNDILFVNSNCYLWGFDFELSLICYYINKKEEGKEYIHKLLLNKDFPDNLKQLTITNSRFYL